MANVLYTYDGKLISDSNPLPVKVAGGVDEEVLEDYYTKEDADGKYQVKGDYATAAQVESLEATVADLQAQVDELTPNEPEPEE